MDLQQLWNRGNNLVATAIIALAGFAFLPEAFLEDDIGSKIDDTGLFLLGLFAIGWYNRAGNKFKHSLIPVILVWLALLLKVSAVVLEFTDKQDVGDDFGGLILFVCASIFITTIYLRKPPSTPPAS